MLQCSKCYSYDHSNEGEMMGSADISEGIFLSPEQIKFIEEMIGKPNMDELIEELTEYASLDGTEVGEYWSSLVNMRDHNDAMGDAFSAALDVEIKEQVEFIRANYKVVEKEGQICNYKYRILEYLGD